MKNIFLIFLIFMVYGAKAQPMTEIEDSVQVKKLQIFGTLCMPSKVMGKIPLVVIIAGSGPTDRNCNGQGFNTNAFKKIAGIFAAQGIATFRYDKRGVGKSVSPNMKEEELRFDDMVNDAKAIIAKFQADKRFSKITVAGHSEGSTVGMISVNKENKYISIAGISQSADVVLKQQLKGKLGNLEESTFKKIDSLKKGNMVVCESPMLMSLFRESVQPYFISWLKINPLEVIHELKGPVLIINGTKDLQVDEKNAEALHLANKNSKLIIIPDMNHVLTEIKSTEKDENLASYNKPELPLSEKFISEMIAFVKE